MRGQDGCPARAGRIGPGEDTGDWMRAFSEVLLSPPSLEILRVDEGPASAPGSG